MLLLEVLTLELDELLGELLETELTLDSDVELLDVLILELDELLL